MEEVKTCKDCGLTKPRQEFHLKGGRDSSSRRRESLCKPCSNSRSKVERRNAYRRKKGIPLDSPIWSVRSGQATKTKKPRGLPRQRMTEEQRFDRILSPFGITSEDYRRMLADQGGVCKICRRTEPGNKRSKRFHVDHCHVTRKVRGLLCHPCNVALGLFKDNPEHLLLAAEYLRK